MLRQMSYRRDPYSILTIMYLGLYIDSAVCRYRDRTVILTASETIAPVESVTFKVKV